MNIDLGDKRHYHHPPKSIKKDTDIPKCCQDFVEERFLDKNPHD